MTMHSAPVQRSRVNSTGGTNPASARPTMTLLAQNGIVSVSNAGPLRQRRVMAARPDAYRAA